MNSLHANGASKSGEESWINVAPLAALVPNPANPVTIHLCTRRLPEKVANVPGTGASHAVGERVCGIDPIMDASACQLVQEQYSMQVRASWLMEDQSPCSGKHAPKGQTERRLRTPYNVEVNTSATKVCKYVYPWPSTDRWCKSANSRRWRSGTRRVQPETCQFRSAGRLIWAR